MRSTAKNPLLVIVGQTASGKTSIAIELAKKYKGEIICADSMTLYKGMDIGTAKPSKKEQQEVPHHLLDICTPDQQFTVADFKKLADQAISDIAKKGKLPILVGGSGLYIDAVIYDYTFRPKQDNKVRALYAHATVAELTEELHKRHFPLPENHKNHRYLLRALEAGEETTRKNVLRPETLVVGIKLDPQLLKERITQRINNMLQNGLLDEVKKLNEQFDSHIAPMQASAYSSFTNYIDGTCTLEQAIEKCAMLDRRLAKKQYTWFKRNKSIQWVSDPRKIVDLTTTFLNN